MFAFCLFLLALSNEQKLAEKNLSDIENIEKDLPKDGEFDGRDEDNDSLDFGSYREDYNYSDPEDFDDYYRYELDAEANISEPCPGPNTRRTKWGYCTCLEGFPYGEPDSVRGCWTCDPFCHNYASCLYPGRCECDRRYKGDGVKHCEAILPRIVEMTPVDGFADRPTQVNISYIYDVAESDYTYVRAYCRFGLIFVVADNVTDKTITCTSPARPPQTVNVAISFDQVTWSNEDFKFVYKNRFSLASILPMVLLYGVILAVISAVLWKVYGSRNLSKATQEEKASFLGGTGKGKGVGFHKKNRKRYAA